jgi:hypothetical protein
MSEREARKLSALVTAPPRVLMTRDQAYAQRSERKNKNKFGNIKVTTDDGEKFDSRAEYRRWCQLLIHVKAKQITRLQRQIPYVLVDPLVAPDGTKLRGVTYIADMQYLDANGDLVVEDVKGVETAEYRIKKKLMLERYGIWVREIRS